MDGRQEGSQFFENMALNGGMSTEDSIFVDALDHFQTKSIVIYESTGDETVDRPHVKENFRDDVSKKNTTVYG